MILPKMPRKFCLEIVKFILNWFQSIVVGLFLIGSVLGCRLIGDPDPPANYIAAKTGTIYIGRVISSTSTVKTEKDYKYRLYTIRFKVERALKGVDSNQIQEISLRGSVKRDSSCFGDPPKFIKGELYVVKKDFDPEALADRDFSYIYDLKPYKYYPEYHQRFIEDLEKAVKKPIAALYGNVHALFRSNLPEGIEVTAQGNGLDLSTKTDANGFYSFANIPAGKYTIEIRLAYETQEFWHNTRTVFNARTNTYNLTYEATIKNNSSDYYYAVVNEPPTK
jgi:hypothetical protein